MKFAKVVKDRYRHKNEISKTNRQLMSEYDASMTDYMLSAVGVSIGASTRDASRWVKRRSGLDRHK